MFFYEASSFNSNLSNWNTAAVTDMRLMFFKASLFNSDLSEWNTTAVITITHMFHGALSFDGDVDFILHVPRIPLASSSIRSSSVRP